MSRGTLSADTRLAGTGLAGTGRPAAAVSVIGLGSSGPAVATLQCRLSALGYWVGAITGRLGSTTEQAVSSLGVQDARSAADIPELS